MNRRPAFQFYPADWRKDPQLQMCNMATQGIWINLLCCMWESTEEGKLEGSWEDFARLLGISVTDIKKFYIQANTHKFADVTNCNGTVTIINRRIYNAFLERERAKKGMRAYRAKQRSENVTPHSSTSSSTSPSKNKYKDFVFLSRDEYQKLVIRFGEQQADKKIDALNDYIGSTGKKYKSHYHTILMWSKKDAPEQQQPKTCVVCRAEGCKYQLDKNNKPVYLCKVCLGFFGAGGWGQLPLGQIERIVEQGKAGRK